MGVTTIGVAGARLEFGEFVRENGRSLYGTAFVLTGDGDAAEELVQDTLVQVFARWSRVEIADQPLAYVRQSLVNRFVSGTRRSSTRDIALADLPERADLSDVEGSVVDRHLVASLISALPARQRAAIVLRYLHDLSDADIAQALGCRQATVRSLISRAMATLRRNANAEERHGAADGGRTQ